MSKKQDQQEGELIALRGSVRDLTARNNELRSVYKSLLRESQIYVDKYLAMEKMCADLQRELKEYTEPSVTPNDFNFVEEYDNKQMLLALKHYQITTPEAIHELVADSQALNGLFHMATKLPNLKKLLL